MNTIQIVARNQYNVIADKDNNIPFNCPSDLVFFKTLSYGKKIVCGRKTFETLPEKVQERVGAIFTTNKNYRCDKAILHDLVSFVDYCDSVLEDQDVLIIGGEQIYNLTFNRVDEIYLTSVKEEEEIATTEGFKYSYYPPEDGFKLNWSLKNLVDGKTGTKFQVEHWKK